MGRMGGLECSTEGRLNKTTGARTVRVSTAGTDITSIHGKRQSLSNDAAQWTNIQSHKNKRATA